MGVFGAIKIGGLGCILVSLLLNPALPEGFCRRRLLSSGFMSQNLCQQPLHVTGCNAHFKRPCGMQAQTYRIGMCWDSITGILRKINCTHRTNFLCPNFPKNVRILFYSHLLEAVMQIKLFCQVQDQDQDFLVKTKSKTLSFKTMTKTKTLPGPLNRLPYHGHKMNKTVYTRHAQLCMK